MSRAYKFGVFAEMGKRGWKFRAYTLWYSSEWEGFMGEYVVNAEDRRTAERKAIEAARVDIERGIKPNRRAAGARATSPPGEGV